MSGSEMIGLALAFLVAAGLLHLLFGVGLEEIDDEQDFDLFIDPRDEGRDRFGDF